MRNWSPQFFLGMAALIACFAAPAMAHHSFAMYDTSKKVVIKGSVQEFNWTNPHATLLVVAVPKPGAAPLTWTLEMTSPGNLRRAGWTKRMFNPGDRVEVTFNPLRSGETGGTFLRATFLTTGKQTPLLGDGYVNGKPADIK